MYAVSDRFLETITGSHQAVVRAVLCASPQFGPEPAGVELPILGGDCKLTSEGDVKGTLDITVPGDYWSAVQPYAGEVHVSRGVDFGDGTQEVVPLGYFRIDDAEQEPPSGPVRLACSDRIAAMIQNRVLFPYQVPEATSHRTIFERLVNGRATPTSSINTAGYAMLATVAVPIVWAGYDPDRATVTGGQVVEDSTYEFLAKLAETKGCVLRFAETGELVVGLRDRDPDAPAVFAIGPGSTGNLVRARRRSRREGVYNIVSAYSSDPATQAAVGYRLAYNSDPNSPLRWSGPFGPAPRYYASPFLRTPDDAANAARSILRRYTGLPETLALWTVPNPALRPLDPVSAKVDGLPAVHLIDDVTIPLAIADAGPCEVNTRTTNQAGDVDVSEPDPVPGTGGAWTAAQIAQEKCFQITNTAEYSTTAWWSNYGNVQDIGDDRGLTCGICGFTSATGDLLELVQDYVTVKPGNVLASFVAGLTTCANYGMGPNATSLANSNLGNPFRSAWAQACTDPVFLKCQRDYRDRVYWTPAFNAAQEDGLGVLGLAIYYDTMINHGPGVAGSGDGSFDDIRSRFGGGGGGGTSLGKTTDGTGSSASSADKTVVSKVTAASTGKVTAGTSRLWVTAGTAGVEMVVYADAAGVPGALLGKSATVTISNTAEAAVPFTFSGADQADIVSGTAYWIGLTWLDPGAGSVTWSRDGTAAMASQNSLHAAASFGAATTLTGPIDAFVTVTPPVVGVGEVARLTEFLDDRWSVLSEPAWDDAQADGRVPMFRGLLASGNLTLTTPFSWTVYGDTFTMDADPAPQSGDSGSGGGGGSSGVAASPGQLHNIGPAPGQNHFNLGVGFKPGSQYGSSATHKDFSQDEIANGLTVPGYYELSADGTYVTATSYPNGGKTSANTKYSRVEYREFEQDGKTKMAFNPSKGRHYISGRSASIAPLSSAKPELVWAQMHDAEDDTAMIYQRNATTIQAKIGDSVVATLSSSYVMGTPTDWMIELVDGTINFYFGDLVTPKHSAAAFKSTTAGQYFKAFNYMQWNTGNGGSNPPPAVVRMYRLEHWHTGWPKPAVPGSTGGGGTGGGTTTPPPTSPAVDGTQAAVALGWGSVVDGDEFEYSGAPNSAKWSPYDGPGHDGNGRRVPSAFSVSGGILTCTGLANGDTGGMSFKRDKRYCRIEWRVRMYSTAPTNRDPRYHPVLIQWPTSDEWPQGGEFDFLETDIDSGKAEAYLHIPGNSGSAQEHVEKTLDIQNWHNYAFEWSKTGIRGYIDGVKWFEYTGAYIQPPGPMHPTFQLDNFFGTKMNPAKFEAMWVRIYQEPT